MVNAAVRSTLCERYEGRINYPFTAIVGQEKMKLALLLNAINPQIGGVLIRGERGSGKTIAVRGLSDILPEIEVAAGCRFSCDRSDISKMWVLCREEYEKAGKLPVQKRRMVSNLGGTEPVYVDGKLNTPNQAEKIFVHPHDVCADRDDNIYVAQWAAGKVYPYKFIRK